MPMKTNPNVDRVLDPPTNETRAWVERGEHNPSLPIIDAAQAVPNYAPPPELTDYLAHAVREPETNFYTPILGLPDLRAALADSLSQQYGSALSHDDIAITCGGNHAFCMALMALAEPGDDVLLPEPFYFNHQMWFGLQGVGTSCVPCSETPEGLLPDLDAAADMVSDRSRALVLVTPNNPTGTVYPPDYLARAYDFARSRDMALVLDETYKDFLTGEEAPHELFSDDDWGDTLVQLYTFSKVYSLTGYRVGAIAAGRRLIGAVAKIADTLTICAPHVSQKAALFGLRNLSDWARGTAQDLDARLNQLRSAFESHQPPFRLVASGAFFAYVRHPFEATPSLDVARRLFNEKSILTWPGSFFGSDQEQYLRLAFANADGPSLEELVSRLAQYRTT